ncbi:putative beta-glucosidase 1 precursor [Phaeomoniella chlamydospora]|uniref:beta-glucosidase n=1 Tax=Phaeomoniella chlamydospora TaxID=158046 RepID=A0A0G2DTE0_PHACM|nr:putative beta-glucosidase 1 precursor [Phaeomoniella chlamydospora]
MTLLEKVNLTTGVGWESERCVGETGSVPRLGLRGLCLQDSPTGVRDTDYNSAFPAGVNGAATWDRGLNYARGEAMGAEHNGKGVDAQLGPVCGPLGRSPDGGRNWEGYSPDPYLTGALIAPTVQGIQAAGVMATTKHLVGNEQEHFRQSSEAQGYGYNITESSSSNIDDKTMHELYLWPFADAVRAGTASIMCSYNQVNNSYACGNSYLLNYLVKNELDFQGFIMSDWAATHGGVSDILAGLDMTMPGDTAFNSGLTFFGTNLTVAILNGTLPQYRLDDMVTRIMAAFYYVGRDTHQVPINFDSWTLDTYAPIHYFVDSPIGLVNEHVDVRGDHAGIIREIGRASTVLLKNTNGALPLKGTERQVGIFGEDAGSNAYGANGCSDRGCDNGTLAMGWGSGTANYPYLVTPEQAIQNYVLTHTNGTTSSITDNYAYESYRIPQLATQAEVALVFVNSDSGEGYINVDGNEGDRRNLTSWKDGDALIANVSAVNNNTIVIIHSVGTVDVSSWYSNPNVTAILWAGLPGQESGNSLVDVLYGYYNPSAKLPFTIGKKLSDYGTAVQTTANNGEGAPQVDFTEGVFIDYRGFDAKNITPVYEFGFGLSYTNFTYSNLSIVNNNAGAYAPTTGTTSSAPTLGNDSTTDPSTLLFPNGSFPYIQYYIYPYLNSTNLSDASGDPDYGEPSSSWLPANATSSSPQPLLPAGGSPGGNPSLYDILYTVSATITNTGSITGAEVAQLYVNLGPNEPPKVLRGFDKLTIAPGASATFTAQLTRRDLSTWDTASQNWIQVQNATVYVGASSRNLPLSGSLS